ncbi:uncharacterized protein LOC103516350 [Diaphorina citri]|uniref:Uncharacterized protein LOC103516350 n=1 Tax=Diaphorina citri TaxID=121845 RepID=A0A1S3DEQ7_DIACI|nr:uncharacterized protein LOC103516350 [Diaphorina citri]
MKKPILFLPLTILFFSLDHSSSTPGPTEESFPGLLDSTNLAPAKLCIPGNAESIANCQTKLKADVQAHLYPLFNLSKLTDGRCAHVTHGVVKGPDGKPAGLVRCCMDGSYSLGPGMEDRLLFHFFNDNGKDAIMVRAFYGKDCLDKMKRENYTETPLAA